MVSEPLYPRANDTVVPYYYPIASLREGAQFICNIEGPPQLSLWLMGDRNLRVYRDDGTARWAMELFRKQPDQLAYEERQAYAPHIETIRVYAAMLRADAAEDPRL